MRLALVIAAAGVLAVGLAASRGGGHPATAAQAPLQLRVSQLEGKVTGICTAFRRFDARKGYHDYNPEFQTLIRSLQLTCGATRAANHEDAVTPPRKKRPQRHEDRPPPPPPHEG